MKGVKLSKFKPVVGSDDEEKSNRSVCGQEPCLVTRRRAGAHGAVVSCARCVDEQQQQLVIVVFAVVFTGLSCRLLRAPQASRLRVSVQPQYTRARATHPEILPEFGLENQVMRRSSKSVDDDEESESSKRRCLELPAAGIVCT